ncbi:7-carboxy-7-deazaguanine synthase QueE [Streptomyces sp. NBC_01471]|uniref:7-carboxy-7-deazaguanine synthase QueE n=1 Tax=Streptomyces sp. NBC_01471 TaxID=2903879 RepID=UPI0032473866
MTVQGEGPSVGRRCAFLRLGGCNLSCSWCDTPYTWDWTGVSDTGVAHNPATELTAMPWPEVLEKLQNFRVPMIVVSGGEPLNQQKRLIPLVRALRETGKRVEIESNGTVLPSPELIDAGVHFNVSPKLSHSGDSEKRRLVPGALKAFVSAPDVDFKFVCRDHADLDEVSAVVEKYGMSSVWIMPEGRNSDDVQRHLSALGDEVVIRGWNLTTRLHVAVWGEKRGV